MSKILFVVHRYYPFPGGSEYNVRNMAEELVNRGHEVQVLTDIHKGDQNGVKVATNYKLLPRDWDLILVHGGDVGTQNVVHENARRIRSPVCYMIIKPSESNICLFGLHYHRFVSYCTSMDIDLIKKYGVNDKARRIRYGIRPWETIKQRNRKKDKKNIFVSAGGFYSHKAMTPLADAFEKANIPNAELHLYGYGEEHLAPKESDKVKVFFGLDKEDVMQAMANADAYIMNSYEEGFGLVLLEAMMNKVPWFARNIAAAHDLCYYGNVYNDEQELMKMLENYNQDENKTIKAYNYVMANHTVEQTANDIEDILLELQSYEYCGFNP